MPADRDLERGTIVHYYPATFWCEDCDRSWSVDMIEELGSRRPECGDSCTKCSECGMEGEEE